MWYHPNSPVDKHVKKSCIKLQRPLTARGCGVTTLTIKNTHIFFDVFPSWGKSASPKQQYKTYFMKGEICTLHTYRGAARENVSLNFLLSGSSRNKSWFFTDGPTEAHIIISIKIKGWNISPPGPLEKYIFCGFRIGWPNISICFTIDGSLSFLAT